MQDCLGAEISNIVRSLVREQLEADVPDLAAVSVTLGIVETCLTNKTQQAWPTDLEVCVTLATIPGISACFWLTKEKQNHGLQADRRNSYVSFTTFADSMACSLDDPNLSPSTRVPYSCN